MYILEIYKKKVDILNSSLLHLKSNCLKNHSINNCFNLYQFIFWRLNSCILNAHKKIIDILNSLHNNFLLTLRAIEFRKQFNDVAPLVNCRFKCRLYRPRIRFSKLLRIFSPFVLEFRGPIYIYKYIYYMLGKFKRRESAILYDFLWTELDT